MINIAWERVLCIKSPAAPVTFSSEDFKQNVFSAGLLLHRLHAHFNVNVNTIICDLLQYLSIVQNKAWFCHKKDSSFIILCLLLLFCSNTVLSHSTCKPYTPHSQRPLLKWAIKSHLQNVFQSPPQHTYQWEWKKRAKHKFLWHPVCCQDFTTVWIYLAGWVLSWLCRISWTILS